MNDSVQRAAWRAACTGRRVPAAPPVIGPARRGGHLARAARCTLLVVLAACTASDRPRGELRFRTDKYAIRVSAEPSPPRARSRTLYKVVISDRESGRPMERAEGQIYASNAAGLNIYDSLEPGPELGTYYATLRFVNSNEWALNMRFRGAPGDTIETVAPDGWRQNVGPAAQ